jgi:hypothetical protein
MLSSPRKIGRLTLSRRLSVLMAFIFALIFVPPILHISHRLAVEGLPDKAPEQSPDGVVYQSTSYSCGPASLAGILRYYGIVKSERELAESAGTSLTLGTQLSGLEAASREHGFEPLVLSPSYEQLDLIRHPAIIFQPRLYHLTTFWGVDSEGRIIIRDPVLGLTRWGRPEYEIYASRHPIVLVLVPGRIGTCDADSMPREISRMQGMLQALGYLSGRSDGVWSNSLTRAVKTFQSDMQIPQTGILDPVTTYYLDGAWFLINQGAPEPFMRIDRPARPANRMPAIYRTLVEKAEPR